MNTILVVDDLKLFRELLAISLRQNGYNVVAVGNAAEAAIAVQRTPPDLIILDIEMPGMDGMEYLERLRRVSETADLPVILLTGSSDKRFVHRASQLRVRDYLIKSAFSVDEVMARVRKYLPLPLDVPSPPPPASTSPVQPAPVAPLVLPQREGVQRLNREEATRRAVKAMPAHALGGVVGQVVALAASPQGDLSKLGAIVARDAPLSARVLRAANSPAYATPQGAVTNLNDAIRNIGSGAVRNLAVSLAVFGALPHNSPDGFNPLHCRQHAFAVAQLCERLCSITYRQEAGAAYLVGLCHDLGELVFREEFGPEYRAVIEAQRRDGRPLSAVEREWFDMTRADLVAIILRHLGLPAAIREPISQFHVAPTANDLPLTRILRLADAYANGMNLTASPSAAIRSFTKVWCRNTTGVDDPPAPDTHSFRSQVVAMTNLLANSGPDGQGDPLSPTSAKQNVRLWLARDPLLSTFDPIAVFLDSLGTLTMNDRLPEAEELKEIDALIVTASSDDVLGLGRSHVLDFWSRIKARNLPILWLVASGEPAPQPDGAPTMVRWPVCMSDIATFVRGLETARAAA